jgi:hypothetical protein
MKAISIRQPWAWAIIHAGKPVENRTWWTDYRGPVLIHAAKGCTRDEYEDCLATVQDISLTHPFPSGLEMPALKDLPRGGIVGRARIVDCVTSSDSPWFTGPYGLVLADVEPLPFRPYKGALGLFEVPDELAGPQPLTLDALKEMGSWPSVKGAVREVVR